MSEHVHDWQRLPEDIYTYRCACGATGYRRYGNARKIIPHKVPRTNRVGLPDRVLAPMKAKK